jgi:superoxide dismutase, Cu-Zn family
LIIKLYFKSPTNKQHGDISFKIRHVGDYGNVVASPDGIIKARIADKVSRLYGPNSIIGRTIIIHEDRDDLGLADTKESKKTGTSGARVACGIIGIDKSN